MERKNLTVNPLSSLLLPKAEKQLPRFSHPATSGGFARSPFARTRGKTGHSLGLPPRRSHPRTAVFSRTSHLRTRRVERKRHRPPTAKPCAWSARAPGNGYARSESRHSRRFRLPAGRQDPKRPPVFKQVAQAASRRSISGGRSRSISGSRACRRPPVRTSFGIVSPRTCWITARICAACKPCSAMPAFPPHRFTPMSRPSV